MPVAGQITSLLFLRLLQVLWNRLLAQEWRFLMRRLMTQRGVLCGWSLLIYWTPCFGHSMRRDLRILILHQSVLQVIVYWLLLEFTRIILSSTFIAYILTLRFHDLLTKYTDIIVFCLASFTEFYWHAL